MKPKFSIVTVCRNACEDFLVTRDSVLSQTCNDFEWLVIDGASTDGTVDKINEIEDSRFRSLSEADAGIYDAMNKGLKMAEGEWVWFLNAGDSFYNAEVLDSFETVPASCSICFGEAEVWSASGERLGLRSEVLPHQCPKRLLRDDFCYGMLVSHQAFVVRREDAPEYNLRYRLSADLDWMLRILSLEPEAIRKGTLVRVIREGATHENWCKSQWERFVILSKHFGFLRTFVRHLYIVVRRFRYECFRRA